MSAASRRQIAGCVRGLTVLEVLVAISLMSVLLGAIFTFFWQTIRIRDQAAEMADRMQIARQTLTRISDELRGCVGFESVGFPIEEPIVEEQLLADLNEDELVEAEITQGAAAADPNDPNAALPTSGALPLLVGDRRSITFLTTQLPAEHQYTFYSESENLPPAQHDLTQVSYRLWVDPDEMDDNGEPIVGGILRTEKKTLNQFLIDYEDPLDVRNDLWSPELGYLEFRYYDGVEWTTSWRVTAGNSLPQLIMITVGFGTATSEELENRDLDEFPIEEYPMGDDVPHPDRYTVIVQIPAADKFFGSRIQRVGQQLEMSEQMGLEGLR